MLDNYPPIPDDAPEWQKRLRQSLIDTMTRINKQVEADLEVERQKRMALSIGIPVLREISKFGKKNSGYGYSCHRMAAEALNKIYGD